MRRFLLAAGIIAAILFSTALPAFAHASLDSSDPEASQSYPAGKPPTSVTLTFSEGVQVAKDGVRVLASSGKAVQGVGEAKHGDKGSVVVAALPALADGTYVVDWQVVSADSHPINGAFTFTVGAATGGNVAGLLKNDTNHGVGIAFGLTRALAFGSVLVLIGGIVFLRTVSGEAGDDPGVRGLLWVSWVIGFVTAVLGIGMQAAYTTTQNLSAMWNTTALRDVMDTRFGQSWLIRAGLLLLVLPALRNPGKRRSPWVNAVDAVLAVFLLATFTFAEHARTGRWILLGTVTDLVHLGSASVWLGGVAVLATLLVRRVVPHDVPVITARFSRIAAPAIVIVAISGAVQAWRQTDGLDSVFDTTYGRLLLTKIGLVVLIVAAASVSRHIVRLWADRQLIPAGPGARRAEADPEDVVELRNAVVVEVAIAVIVLLVTALLVNTAPARVEGGSTSTAAAPTPSQPVKPAGYSATLSNAGIQFDVKLSPGLKGTNQLTVATTKAGAPFDPIDITAKLTDTEQAVTLNVPMTKGAAGTGTAQGNIDLPFAGTWKLEIRALRTDVDESVVTDDVEILQQFAEPRSRGTLDGVTTVPTRYWHALPDGRVQCDVCPRACKLRDGQRGLCFVRAREGDGVVLTTYGRSSGFCVDPIEKKPLNHFLPGSSVLSFGTAGCNLACRFCQNWDISKSKEVDTLADAATPDDLVAAAQRLGCRSVAFTYNDPTIFLEYAIDVADACRAVGISSVAVTAGYISPEPRREMYAHMDAANVDLKAFTEDFYRHVCGAHLADVLDTLEYLVHDTDVWVEITTLLIPGRNDDPEEIDAMTRWVVEHLGPNVPLHFTAFHPDFKMMDVGPTPPATLTRARAIARGNGVRYAYTGNVHDSDGGSTRCIGCGTLLIERDWYRLGRYHLTDDGCCRSCGTALPGHFDGPAGTWGARRLPVRIGGG